MIAADLRKRKAVSRRRSRLRAELPPVNARTPILMSPVLPPEVQTNSARLCSAVLALSLAALAVNAASPEAPAAARAPGQLEFPLTVASNLMVDLDLPVATRVTGVIETLHVDRGALVKKGQPLASLDQRALELDRRAAEETLNVARTDFERTRELRSLNLVSQAEFETKKAHYELARVEAEQAQLVLERSVVRAPFDGIVVDRFARIGQKVLLEENVPLFRVAALEPLIARAYLPEQAFQRVRAGNPVEVTATEFPGVTSAGKVSFVSPVIDAASGTVQVIVQVPRDGKRVLRPGMAVRMTFAGNPSR
jgi:membrane fusion protein (multidrug efflux system)